VPTWPSSRLAYARAHGNPFFVAELGRLHGPGDARPGALPEAVRDTLRVRLHSLTPAGQDVLSAAAVLGAAVDPAVVAAVTGREVAAVLAVLDEAAAAGLVAGGDGPEAAALAASAAFSAERLGMLPLLRNARGLAASLDGTGAWAAARER
jgi:hypothetical protein